MRRKYVPGRIVSRRVNHRVALELPYEEYIRRNGGEKCGICGNERKSRRLHRDHDHRTGRPRGLLCFRCNRNLPYYADVEWLVAATAYLIRHTATERSGEDGDGARPADS